MCRELERWVDQQALELVSERLVEDTMVEAPFAERLFRLYAGCPDKAPTMFLSE